MKRVDNWRSAFAAAIEAHRPFPFAWGTHDCGLLTADCIKAVTGIDIGKNFRGGRYDSRETAKAFVAMCGYEDATEVVARHFAEIHPSQAIAGDIAVVVTRQGPALCPVLGAELAAYSKAGVLGALPLSAASRAFRIEIA